MMLAFWSLASNHCQIETLSGLTFLECAAATATESHCNDSECAGVEAGGYKVEERESLLPVLLATAVLAPLILPAEPLETGAAPAVSLTVASPEFPRSWQFISRAALPVRAPSFAS